MLSIVLRDIVEKDHLLEFLEKNLLNIASISLPPSLDHLLQFLEHESTHAVISSPANLSKLDVRIIYHNSEGLFDNCFFRTVFCSSKLKKKEVDK